MVLVATLQLPIGTHAGDKPLHLIHRHEDKPRLALSGTHRTRYESLTNQFRNGVNGGDQMVALRTLVRADLNFDQILFAAELEDSRGFLMDQGTPQGVYASNPTGVNPLELLQANVTLRNQNLLGTGFNSSFRGGRLTMDIGSRRLVARNRYRNTINAFTGVDWQLDNERAELRMFYTFPTRRRVDSGADTNDAKFDKESKYRRFWGIYFRPKSIPMLAEYDTQFETFFFGRERKIDEDFTSRIDQTLYTPGARLWRPAAVDTLDYQLEGAYQFGRSRNADVSSVDKRAYFMHAEFGYSWSHPWKPRTALQFDMASGDRNGERTNGTDNRFDTLFGARRFDFGPTGIYGPFARANIISPGVRMMAAPTSQLKGLIAMRGFWLQSARDQWTVGRIQDTTGNAGRYLGIQAETRLQYDLVPGNVRLEGGVAYLFEGAFPRDAPRDNLAPGNSFYGYTQLVLKF